MFHETISGAWKKFAGYILTKLLISESQESNWNMLRSAQKYTTTFAGHNF